MRQRGCRVDWKYDNLRPFSARGSGILLRSICALENRRLLRQYPILAVTTRLSGLVQRVRICFHRVIQERQTQYGPRRPQCGVIKAFQQHGHVQGTDA
jgi:hypothetical protein